MNTRVKCLTSFMLGVQCECAANTNTSWDLEQVTEQIRDMRMEV